MTQITNKQLLEMRSVTSQLRAKIDGLSDRAPDDPDVLAVAGLLEGLENNLKSEGGWVPVERESPQTEPAPKTQVDQLRDQIRLMRVAHVSSGMNQFDMCAVLDGILDLIETKEAA